MLAGQLLDELLEGVELLELSELLDTTEELLEASEELLEASEELLTTSEELLAASEEVGIEISELAATLDSATTELATTDATDELVGVVSPPVLAATLLVVVAVELFDEDLTELLEDDFTDDLTEEVANTEEDFPVLVDGVELLPPPQAVNTTVRDKADRARSEYMLKFSIVYLAVLCPYPRAEKFIYC